MAKRKSNHQRDPKLPLIILSFVCMALIALTFTERVNIAPLRRTASVLIVPLQNGINTLGGRFSEWRKGYANVRELTAEKEALEQRVAALEEENTIYTEHEQELQELRDLYQLDQDYSAFDKVAAEVIAKEPGNWFSTFTINRGADDGIETGMNVLASGGLAGIITETGRNWATVRTIIDNDSRVSATIITGSDNCIVAGDMDLMESGKLSISQINADELASPGEKVVTSSISDKYLRGILIGYIDEITDDPNHLTKNGYLIPAVDFQHIDKVFVILRVKSTGGNVDGEPYEPEPVTDSASSDSADSSSGSADGSSSGSGDAASSGSADETFADSEAGEGAP